MLTALFLTQIKGLVMNNTDKLLRAFIEASGFDVEEVITKQELISPESPIFNRTIETIDYKVTKKRSGGIKCTKCGTHLAHSKPLDSCLCKTPLNLVRFD